MLYRTNVSVIENTNTSDGMGGSTVVQSVASTIQAHISPIRSELLYKQYGLTTTQAFRLVTKDSIPRTVTHLQIGTIKYKVLELLEYRRYSIALLEVVK